MDLKLTRTHTARDDKNGSYHSHDPVTLVCPHCGSDYVHHGAIEVCEGDCEDSGNVMLTHVDGNTITTTAPFRDGVAWGRRGDLRMHFMCEQCPRDFWLIVQQHKGQTLVFTSDYASPKPAASAWRDDD